MWRWEKTNRSELVSESCWNATSIMRRPRANSFFLANTRTQNKKCATTPHTNTLKRFAHCSWDIGLDSLRFDWVFSIMSKQSYFARKHEEPHTQGECTMRERFKNSFHLPHTRALRVWIHSYQYIQIHLSDSHKRSQMPIFPSSLLLFRLPTH